MTPFDQRECPHLPPPAGSSTDSRFDPYPFIPIPKSSPFPADAMFVNVTCHRETADEYPYDDSRSPSPAIGQGSSNGGEQKSTGRGNDLLKISSVFSLVPPKMKLLGKMTSQNNIITRICSDCKTTKTPLWRSGPCGPKSLCNACGIRQRKARRAMAVAGLIPAAAAVPAKPRKEKTLDHERTVPFKKRCKFTSADATRPERLDQGLSLSDNCSTTTTFQRGFPQEEKEAAILLMALSCSLIRS